MNSLKLDVAGEIKRIGKYEVVGVLGRGGMGVVYQAKDKLLNREVAIKTLTEGVADDPDMLARFYEEGRKTARLKHPNIVTVYELGEEDKLPYIVMERVEGDPLDKILRSNEIIPILDRLRIMEEVCDALGYAHKNNVIHRDVKPANVFVQPDGHAKLLDFGIARLERNNQELSLTRIGHIIGTIPYMAPERLRDHSIDSRSDIFSAGVLLYQLVAQQLPFTGEDLVLMQKIINEPHPRLSSVCSACSPELDAVVDRALAKSADDRYQTADEMASELASVIADLKENQVQDLLPEARRLVEANEWSKAKSVLQKLLKIQSRNTEARSLLSEIHVRLIQRQREDRIEHFRQLAEDAFHRDEYENCLTILGEGLDVDPANALLLELKSRAEAEKVKRKQIVDFLTQAELARRRGDFRAAVVSAQEALKIDDSDSKIILLCKTLALQAEEVERNNQARELIDAARQHISSANYRQAIEVLRAAEELDSTDPDVQLLFNDATAGFERQRRKEIAARLEEQLATAASLDQLRDAAKSIQESLTTSPEDSGLYRLSALADRRIRNLESIQLVEDAILACRDLRTREALEVVRSARKQLPGNERLLSLERRLVERLQQQSVEERRIDFLFRAREALRTSDFSKAIQILKECAADRVSNDEVMALLEFAEKEESERLHQEALKAKLDRAQSAIEEGEFDSAIEFLTAELQLCSDPALRVLLDEAMVCREALQKQVTAIQIAAGKILQEETAQDALNYLAGLQGRFSKHAGVKSSVVALQNQMDAQMFRKIGQAYALLVSDINAADMIFKSAGECAHETFDKEEFSRAFRVQEEEAADRIISETILQCRKMPYIQDKPGVDALAKRATKVLDWASPESRSTWLNLQSRLSIRGIIRKLRS